MSAAPSPQGEARTGRRRLPACTAGDSVDRGRAGGLTRPPRARSARSTRCLRVAGEPRVLALAGGLTLAALDWFGMDARRAEAQPNPPLRRVPIPALPVGHRTS